MKKTLWIMMAFLIAAATLGGCGKPTPQPPAAITKAPTQVATAMPPPKPAWQQEWETTLEKAKQEGSVSVYALWRPETRTALTEAFGKKYGINLEYTPFARGAELLAKVKAEQTAGIQGADVFGAGGPTMVATMKPEGVLGQIEPVLLLPEVLNAASWSGGKFPFLDKDKYAIGMIASIQRYIVYNTDMIKKGEITSYKDVLKPQYKGKVTLNDPTVTGVGNAFLSHLAIDIWNLDDTKEYLKQLITDQEVVIQRDNRIHVESVVRGKYAIGLAPLPDGMVEFMNAGAHIEVVFVKEGTFVSPAAGALGIPTKFAHPNAAKVFINWLLTKEGATVFSQSFGNPSLRSDVSTEGILPIFLAQPGEKIYLDSEENILFRGKMRGIAKEVIDAASK
ncbi:MAG: ABC transporter substrate-binding protein [Dehalococcoidia bacterium]|nr:ABC transporter substrate-binding protein [Dehalococcoidia bacterium]